MKSNLTKSVKLLIYLWYLLILLVVTTISLEIIVRFNPEISKNKEETDWLRSMMKHDPLLGWKHVPNTKIRVSNENYDVEYSINSKGHRDAERTYDKTLSTFRIVCPGDSITFGWGVEQKHRFTDLLEKSFKNVEVLNMAVQGYGFDQIMLMFEQECIKYEPDLVLVYLIHENFRRACWSKMWSRNKPLFQIRNSELTLTNVPVPSTNLLSADSKLSDQFYFRVLRKSYLSFLIERMIHKWKYSRIPVKGDEKRQLEITQLLLLRYKKLTDTLDIPLLIMIEKNATLDTFLEQHNFYFCDDPTRYYLYKNHDLKFEMFIDDMWHPSPLGHSFIAKTFLENIKKLKLVPDEYY